MEKKEDDLQIKKVGRKYIITDRQLQYLRFVVNRLTNAEIATKMGVSQSTLIAVLRKHGIRRSKHGLSAIQHKTNPQRIATAQARGVYEVRRGKPLSEKVYTGLKRWREENQGESTWSIIKKQNPERYHQWRKDSSKKRRELIASERKRVQLGLPQTSHISLNVLGMCRKFTKKETYRRYSMKKLGYILGDPNPKFGERYTLFYDEETERNANLERHATADGFSIRLLPEED